MSERRFDGYKKSEHDRNIEDLLVHHLHRYGLEKEPLEAVKLWPVLVRRQWLKRFLAHLDLFRLTLEVPGDIVELGVFRGHDLMTWANLLECYALGDRTKTVWGFDTWTGFPTPSTNDVGADAGAFDPGPNALAELNHALSIFDSDRFCPQKPRVKLVEGDLESTLPVMLETNPGLRFSLLHFDCDLYQPTRVGLQLLWPRLSRGGLALFDEYGQSNWPGETKAVDEFLSQHHEITLHKFDWTNAPAAYAIKP